MKVATLLILFPAVAADSESVNQARSKNPNLRGGEVVRKQSHRHEGHSLLEEFRQQRAHKKDLEDVTADGVAEVGDAGEQIVGPGKYLDPDDVHKKSLAQQNKAHPAVFRTSRLSRGEMEKRAYEMETKLQQVEEGTLELNEKTVDRYKKFVERYNELEKEIYLMNHPEEKEAEDGNTTSNGDAADEKKTSTSAYSSGKAEYEKTIEKMKGHKEKQVSGENVSKAVEVGEEKVTEKATSTGKKSEYVYGADGSKQLRIVDDDEINQLDIPDEIVSKGDEDAIGAVATGKEPSTVEDDDDIPPNFEGLAEGKMTSKTSEKSPEEEIVVSDDTSDVAEDNIPPNLSEEPEERVAMTHPRGNDEIPADIVENSLEKVKKLTDVVSNPELSMKNVEEAITTHNGETDDTDEAPLSEDREAATSRLEGGDTGSEDAGTEEMDKNLLPKPSERDMNADGVER